MTNILTLNDPQEGYPDSYYAATRRSDIKSDAFPKKHDHEIVIIGGGFTGLSCALHLAKQGKNPLVLEAKRFGWGASGRNGGQLGTGQRKDPIGLEKYLGRSQAKEVFNIGVEATQLVKDLIKNNNIDTPVHNGTLYVNHKKRFDKYSKELVEFQKKHYDYHHEEYLSQEEMADNIFASGYYGGSIDTNTAHIHPLRYCLGLASSAKKAGGTLCSDTEVLHVSGNGPYEITTNRGVVSAKYIVYATNGYSGLINDMISKYVLPLNNFIVATQPFTASEQKQLIKEHYAVSDSRNVINYYRFSEDGRLLFGGGEYPNLLFPKNVKSMVENIMVSIFPQTIGKKIDFVWGGTLGITFNRMPFLMKQDNSYISAGYNGYGVHMASMCGKLVADAILGDDKKFLTMANLPKVAFPGGKHGKAMLAHLALRFYAFMDRF